MTTMKLKPANTRKENGGGYVLFGTMPDASRTFRGRPTNWLERWFSTPEKALAYATKRGWGVVTCQ